MAPSENEINLTNSCSSHLFDKFSFYVPLLVMISNVYRAVSFSPTCGTIVC